MSLRSFLFLALGFAPFAFFEADLLCLQWWSTRGHQWHGEEAIDWNSEWGKGGDSFFFVFIFVLHGPGLIL